MVDLRSRDRRDVFPCSNWHLILTVKANSIVYQNGIDIKSICFYVQIITIKICKPYRLSSNGDYRPPKLLHLI